MSFFKRNPSEFDRLMDYIEAAPAGAEDARREFALRMYALTKARPIEIPARPGTPPGAMAMVMPPMAAAVSGAQPPQPPTPTVVAHPGAPQHAPRAMLDDVSPDEMRAGEAAQWAREQREDERDAARNQWLDEEDEFEARQDTNGVVSASSAGA